MAIINNNNVCPVLADGNIDACQLFIDHDCYNSMKSAIEYKYSLSNFLCSFPFGLAVIGLVIPAINCCYELPKISYLIAFMLSSSALLANRMESSAEMEQFKIDEATTSFGVVKEYCGGTIKDMDYMHD